VNDFLQKPVRQEDLLQTIISVFNEEESNKKECNEVFQKNDLPTLEILLAEDNIVNQKVASNLLKKWGHNVTIVNDGKEAIEILTTKAFDMILMDVQMPNVDGVEATKRIRNSKSSNISSHIPIIAMTAHAMKGDRERFIKAGMNDYISKPIDLKEVFAMMKKYAIKKAITQV
jgi:CheY-like chemotaxis protein